MSLTIRWDERVAAAFLRAYDTAKIPAYATLARGVRLLLADDLAGLEAWGQTLTPEQDDAELLFRVLGAAYRHVRRGDSPLEDVLESILSFGLQRQAEPLAAGEAALLLSAREIEIGLLGGELSNIEIAERLRISKRTVENHIANALKKAGMSGRKELSRFLHSQ
ncbi:MAG: LuxR C-terminal-related transcriptional regulator [Leucobacter sp.]